MPSRHQRFAILPPGLFRGISAFSELEQRIADEQRRRLVELDVSATDAADARAQIERMCEQLLANPLIESYEITGEGPPLLNISGSGADLRTEAAALVVVGTVVATRKHGKLDGANIIRL